MLAAAHAFIVRTADWGSPALAIFLRSVAVVSLIGSTVPYPSALARALASGWHLRLGLEATQRQAGPLDDRLAIVIAECAGGLKPCRHERREPVGRLANRALGILHVLDRDPVEEAGRQRQQDGDLCRHPHGGELRLLEASADSPPMLDALAGVVIEVRTKAGEGLQLLEL